MKRQKKIVEELKRQNHTEHLWKKPKHNPLHFWKGISCSFTIRLECIFTDLDASGGGLQNCLKFQKQ